MKSFCCTLGLLATVAVQACAPYFPPSYLADRNPYRMRFYRAYELELLARRFWPEEAEFKVAETKGLSTAEGTERDFRRAVGGPEAAGRLRRYLEFDAACRRAELPPLPPELPPAEQEFYLYSRGFAELHQTPPAFFPAAWRQLLTLPKERRRQRTTWVLFMLGNSHFAGNFRVGHHYYRQLREAVRDGFADSLNLQRRSYQLEGRTLEYWPLAVWKLGIDDKEARETALDLLKAEVPETLLQDPRRREIFFLYLPPERIAEYAARLPPGQALLVAERLAAECYEYGDWKTCELLLESFVPADSLIRLFLEARLLRGNGDSAGAAAKLQAWLKRYRELGEAAPAFDRRNFFMDDHWSYPIMEVKLVQVAQGMLGAILVEQDHLLEALHAFLQAGSLNDAAALAEETLKLDTLIEYCRNHTNADEPAGRESAGQWLRHLLGRRLMREFRAPEAGEFLPALLQSDYRRYCELQREANNLTAGRDQRALALFNLGRLIRQSGWYLFGTELGPDYLINGGGFAGDAVENWNRWPPPLVVKPKLRYSHRYLAAQTFARAAFLAEDGNLKAVALHAAGCCLKFLDPYAADEYYKLLCDLRPHPLAEAAAADGWFPRRFPALNRLLDLREPLRLLKPEDFPPLLRPESTP